MGLKEKSLISFSPNEIDSAATHHLQMCRQGYSLDECPLYRVANQPDTDVLGPWEEVACNPHRENTDTPGGKPWKFSTPWGLLTQPMRLYGLAQVADALLPLLYISTYVAAVLGSVTVGERWWARSTVTLATTRCTWGINTIPEQSWRTSKNCFLCCVDGENNIGVL